MANSDNIFIYIHIPKAAGISFINIIREEYGSDNLLRVYSSEQRQELRSLAGTPEANKYKAVIGHLPFGAHKFFTKDPIYVSVLRDPIDRYVSLYNWLRESPQAGNHQKAIDLNIDDFFDHLINNVPGEEPNSQCRYICGHPSFPEAKRFIQNYYFAVGVLDYFTEFCEYLIKELHWHKHILLNKNNSASQFTRTDISAATIRKIEKLHSEDFQLYNYVKKHKDGICKGSPKKTIRTPRHYIRKTDGGDLNTPEKQKVFNIGWQKTGTTSIHAAMEMLDLKVLADVAYYTKWRNGQTTTKELIDVVDDYFSTKDYPWTLLYKELAAAYPTSKFILTLRDPEEWLESLRQHILRNPIQPAMNFIYGRYFNASDFSIRDQQLALAKYHQHNADVLDFFEGTDRLLVMDLKTGEGWGKLCPFLGIEKHPAMKEDFPVANKWKYR